VLLQIFAAHINDQGHPTVFGNSSPSTASEAMMRSPTCISQFSNVSSFFEAAWLMVALKKHRLAPRVSGSYLLISNRIASNYLPAFPAWQMRKALSSAQCITTK
jgi:hypothetical protein